MDRVHCFRTLYKLWSYDWLRYILPYQNKNKDWSLKQKRKLTAKLIFFFFLRNFWVKFYILTLFFNIDKNKEENFDIYIKPVFYRPFEFCNWILKINKLKLYFVGWWMKNRMNITWSNFWHQIFIIYSVNSAKKRKNKSQPKQNLSK